MPLARVGRIERPFYPEGARVGKTQSGRRHSRQSLRSRPSSHGFLVRVWRSGRATRGNGRKPSLARERRGRPGFPAHLPGKDLLTLPELRTRCRIPQRTSIRTLIPAPIRAGNGRFRARNRPKNREKNSR
jgi:hypothetical protein